MIFTFSEVTLKWEHFLASNLDTVKTTLTVLFVWDVESRGSLRSAIPNVHN